MPEMLGRTKAYADQYIQSAQSVRTTWDEVREEHAQAMVVRELEDTMAMGVTVIKIFLKRSERWHDWVSSDSSHYDPEQHGLLEKIERRLVGASERIIRLIDRVKQSRYDVDGESAFRQSYDDLQKRAGYLCDNLQPSDAVRDALERAKQRRFEDQCETRDNPWSTD